MITFDWKTRLKKDTNDFFHNKLPNKDFDIDLIYNAYPIRKENNVPNDVVTFVAKNLANNLVKTDDLYLDFFEYVWNKKGDSGKLAVSIIINKLALKNPNIYLEFTKDKLIKNSEQHNLNIVLDKIIYVIVKKNPKIYLEFFYLLLTNENYDVKIATLKLLIKISKTSQTILKDIQMFLENKWFTASEEIIKLSIYWLKGIASINQNSYIAIFNSYKKTKDPLVAEILSHSIKHYDPIIEEMLINWAESGNSKLKKSGITGLKTIKKLKK